jgi:hypothetical protein
MKPRRHTIRLRTGDVRELHIYHCKHAFRLVIYDENSAVPLIQARLNTAERQEFRKTLGRSPELHFGRADGAWDANRGVRHGHRGVAPRAPHRLVFAGPKHAVDARSKGASPQPSQKV